MNISTVKFLVLSLLYEIFSSTSVMADEFFGSRLGIGVSTTSITTDELADFDYGSGFKLEYGYDFNRIVGTGLSYETNEDTINGAKMQGHANKLSYDFGYAFSIQRAFFKPYVKLGFVFYSEESAMGSEFDDNGELAGLGIRFQYRHFYIDMNVDAYTLEDGPFELEFTQTAVTTGYKF